ncbi:MAG: hypothetical protein D6696_21225, partial [Acidobacteria bacterium]
AAAQAAAARAAALEASYEHHLLHGQYALCAGDRAAAQAAFERALAVEPGGWRAHLDLAWIDLKDEAWTRAEERLRAALAGGPPEAVARRTWSQLGMLYERREAFDQAIAAYLEAGDESGVARARANRRTAADLRRYADMAAEAAALEAELEALDNGG